MNNYWLHKKDSEDLAEMMEAYRVTLEAEYELRYAALAQEYKDALMQARQDFSEELAKTEKVAEEGYTKAWKVIEKLQEELGEMRKTLPPRKFKPGDVVCAFGSGECRIMTVKQYSTKVICNWFENKNLMNGTFKESDLGSAT
jgi:uncharacterized protein YodC (DUF2158 family)